MDYKQKFPNLFTALQDRKTKPGQWEKDFEIRLAFPDSTDVEYSGRRLMKYLSECAFKRMRLAPGSYSALHLESVAEVRELVDSFHAKPVGGGVKVVLGQEHLHSIADRYPPPTHVWPKRLEGIAIGQRGVYIKTYGKVPCGSWGTVVGIFGQCGTQEIELLLDDDSFSASDLCGRAPDMRGLQIPLEDFLPIVADRSAGGACTQSSWAAEQQAELHRQREYSSVGHSSQ